MAGVSHRKSRQSNPVVTSPAPAKLAKRSLPSRVRGPQPATVTPAPVSDDPVDLPALEIEAGTPHSADLADTRIFDTPAAHATVSEDSRRWQAAEIRDPGLSEEGNSLRGYLNVEWYLDQIEDDQSSILEASDQEAAAIRHYLETGASQLLSPHPLFSTEYYLAQYPDIAEAKLNPFVHYVRTGFKERRQSHPACQSTAPLSEITSELFIGRCVPLMFDADFYRDTNPDVAAAAIDPLAHYMWKGVREGRSPHPLFNSRYYLSQVDANATIRDPLVHYVTNGWKTLLNPHPLVNTTHMLKQLNGSTQLDPLTHYISNPWSGISPHVLFNSAYYRRNVGAVFGSERNPLVHYLRKGYKKGISPHPLFDPAYYAAQAGDAIGDEPPLAHYIASGVRDGLSPHPLFDPDFLAHSSGDERFNSLLHYLTDPERASPNYLFDNQWYRERANSAAQNVSLLEHYVMQGAAAGLSTHPLFDIEYYKQQVADYRQKSREEFKGANLLAILKDLDDKAVQSGPLQHYLSVGWRRGLSPHRAFDPRFYAEQVSPPVVGDPVRHYLTAGAWSRIDPHPAFDTAFYLSQVPELDAAKTPPLLHFLRMPDNRRAMPTPVLDPRFYLDNNDDLRTYNVCPALHVVTYGAREGRLPNRLFSEPYVYRQFPEYAFDKCNATIKYLAERCYRRTRILFVGHEASRTGAPLILLKILQHFAAEVDCDAVTFLGRGGELLDEFRKVSHVYVMKGGNDQAFLNGCRHSDEWLEEARSIWATAPWMMPELVVCNTAETRSFMQFFADQGIPVVSLVHEAADPYDAAQWRVIYQSSKLVIFPSEYVRRRALRKLPQDPERYIIRGQGLLEARFARTSRTAALERVRKEFAISSEHQIVLGCGTVDRRKGVDLFVETAARMLRDRAPTQRPLFFLWIGAGPDDYDSALFWCREFIDRHGIADSVRFAGNRSDTAPYFAAADVYLLTSRADPFPCVVHEAMACGVPVIGFDGATGSPDCFEDSGSVVPMGDTAAMATAALRLLDDDKRRSRMGKLGRSLIKEKWSYGRYVDDLIGEIRAATGVEVKHAAHAAAGGVSRVAATARTAPRIFFSSPDWGISGVNTFTVALIERLNRMGYDARLLFTNGRFTAMPDETVRPQVPVTYLQPPLYRPDSIWYTLLEFLREQEPCIYVPNYDYIASSACPLMPDHVGIVGIAHSDDVEHYEHTYRLGLYWDRIVNVSKYIEKEIVAMNTSFAPKCATIYYGVPFDEAGARAAIARRSKRSQEPLSIVYAGRLVEKQKNCLAYINLAKRLAQRNVPFHLTLIGDGELYDRLSWELAGLIGSGFVSLPGRLAPEEIGRIFADADAFVLLSDFEGLPLAMLEAMALGVIPVVRDMKSGIPEVVTNGKDGFICARDNLDPMVDVFARLQQDRALRTRMSHAVVDKFMAKELSSEDMAQNYSRLFDEVLTEVRNRAMPRRDPLAHNAYIYGIQAPPFLQWRP